MKPRALVVGCVAAALVGVAVSWIGTAPRHLTGLHWDTGSYLARFATTSDRWRNVGVPWLSHLALPQIYIGACALAELVGGSCFAGFRALQALCLGGALALFFVVAARLSRSYALGLVLVLCLATAWGTLVLVFGMVDDLVHWPAEMGVLYVCLTRIDDWRDRDSLVAGLLVAAASLVSLQCVLWMLPALFVATLLGGARRWRVRARHAALLVGTFVALLLVWGLVLGLTTYTPMRTVFGVMTARPQASYVPKDARGLRNLFDAHQFLRHLGVGIAQQLASVFESDWIYAAWPSIGGWLVAVEIVAFGVCVVGYRKKRVGPRLLLLTFTLLAFTLVTSMYHDHITEKYKRYAFLTLFTFALFAAIVGAIARARRTVVGVSVGVAALVAVAQLVHGVGENREWHESQPYFPHGLADYLGRDHLSWMAYFEALGRANPRACRFVFDVQELTTARWNHEVTAALVTELPRYAMIGRPPEVARWKEKPPLIAPGAYNQVLECDWLSPQARTRLQSP